MACRDLEQPFAVISGNLGTGKTSLLKKLSILSDWNCFPEPDGVNPYLDDFYRDMESWSFHLQAYLLGWRTSAQKAASSGLAPGILDRSIYEDAHIFAPMLRDENVLSKRDFDTYEDLFELISESLPRPSLIVYLECSVPCSMQRIKSRAHGFDSGISPEYLVRVRTYYDTWITGLTIPVLRIDSEAINLLSDENVIAHVREPMLEYLESK
jgi:deoxyadenosine/deoxycytidine kinase